jgi:hypothetical protein
MLYFSHRDWVSMGLDSGPEKVTQLLLAELEGSHIKKYKLYWRIIIVILCYRIITHDNKYL